ncbi:MAG TPA: hypothetical protein VLB86_12260 [Gaiellaceae bacterium]|nr:hypothetical protein [Gaiellaceae bacterium]
MKRTIFVAAAAAVAMLTLAASASADVPRYQTQTATLTADVLGGAYVHVYTIVISPCDGSFTGTAAAGSVVPGETVNGSLTDSNLTIDFDGLYPSGYAWSYSGPLSGGTGHGPDGQTFGVTFSLANVTDQSDWKNHGQYVKAMGGGSDAAHSCLGMPIPYSWSETGTIDSTSMAGTTTSVPVDGTYRIDVSGTWVNTPYGPVDAEYTSLDNWATHEDGFDHAPYLLGAGFGDVQVNGQFVDWGAYSATHGYSLTTALVAGSVHLGIFDGDSTIPMQMPWYGDNSGTLSYEITYVGP